jgi:hypothetical protein
MGCLNPGLNSLGGHTCDTSRGCGECTLTGRRSVEVIVNGRTLPTRSREERLPGPCRLDCPEGDGKPDPVQTSAGDLSDIDSLEESISTVGHREHSRPHNEGVMTILYLTQSATGSVCGAWVLLEQSWRNEGLGDKQAAKVDADSSRNCSKKKPIDFVCTPLPTCVERGRPGVGPSVIVERIIRVGRLYA